jgi:TFIIF-interacting CTD phosphatase-like protein
VLVLDLDNTLLHSTEKPITSEMLKDKKYWRRGVEVVDAARTLYHAWCPEGKFSYFVKLRPFVLEFMIMAMKSFQIYFYTAANR